MYPPNTCLTYQLNAALKLTSKHNVTHFFLQNPSHGNILTYGQDGFLLVPPYNIDIYEWNGDNEILEKTALTLSPVRPGSAALTVTTDALLC